MGGAVGALGGGTATLGGQVRDVVTAGVCRNTVGIFMGLGGVDDEEDGAWDEGVNHEVFEGWVGRAVRLLKAGSLFAEIVSGADTVLVVTTQGGAVKVRDVVDSIVEEVTVIRDDCGAEVGMGESSRISKIEESREDVSEAFLFILVTSRGLAGVPLQL